MTEFGMAGAADDMASDMDKERFDTLDLPLTQAMPDSLGDEFAEPEAGWLLDTFLNTVCDLSSKLQYAAGSGANERLLCMAKVARLRKP